MPNDFTEKLSEKLERMAEAALDATDPYWRNMDKARRKSYLEDVMKALKEAATED